MVSMSESKEPLVIYWTPGAIIDKFENGNWNTMYGSTIYPDPKNLHATLMKEKNPDRGPTTFISCPAALNTFRKTFAFYNSKACQYDYDLTNMEKPRIDPKGEDYLNYAVRRPPALIDKPTIEFQLRWIFFSEESLDIDITPPMFSQPKYTKYGTCVPGQYNIGQWYRPFVFEVQMWEPRGTFILEKDEPLFYATFFTDRPIVLKRYVYTEKLDSISKHLIASTTNEPLDDRYDLFNNTSQRELILKNIKENLLE
jgi:hypothetical protein